MNITEQSYSGIPTEMEDIETPSQIMTNDKVKLFTEKQHNEYKININSNNMGINNINNINNSNNGIISPKNKFLIMKQDGICNNSGTNSVNFNNYAFNGYNYNNQNVASETITLGNYNSETPIHDSKFDIKINNDGSDKSNNIKGNIPPLTFVVQKQKGENQNIDDINNAHKERSANLVSKMFEDYDNDNNNNNNDNNKKRRRKRKGSDDNNKKRRGKKKNKGDDDDSSNEDDNNDGKNDNNNDNKNDDENKDKDNNGNNENNQNEQIGSENNGETGSNNGNTNADGTNTNNNSNNETKSTNDQNNSNKTDNVIIDIQTEIKDFAKGIIVKLEKLKVNKDKDILNGIISELGGDKGTNKRKRKRTKKRKNSDDESQNNEENGENNDNEENQEKKKKRTKKNTTKEKKSRKKNNNDIVSLSDNTKSSKISKKDREKFDDLEDDIEDFKEDFDLDDIESSGRSNKKRTGKEKRSRKNNSAKIYEYDCLNCGEKFRTNVYGNTICEYCYEQGL